VSKSAGSDGAERGSNDKIAKE
jgi:hypothetical protein